MSAMKGTAATMPASRPWTERAFLAMSLLATAVGAWIGVLYLLSPHASEVALPRRD